MFRFLATAPAVLLLSSALSLPAASQTFTSRDAVIKQCAAVAAAEQRAKNVRDHELRGFCIRATGEYVAVLAASPQPDEAIGVEFAALVVDLANLLVVRACVLDSEIGDAIQLVGGAAKDPEQEVQIKSIAVLIDNCDFGVTAALPRRPVAQPPADGGSSLTFFEDSGGGLPASFS